MRDVKIQVLREAVHALSSELEENNQVTVQEHFLTGKGKNWLEEVFLALGGKGRAPLLKKLKFDLKIGRNVFLYDDEVHFNRYRLETFRSSVYEEMTFEWIAAHKRLCRTYEKAALKGGVRERVWLGPPLAQRLFGAPGIPPELQGGGAPGWKLTAYNDAQYDILCKLHGLRLHRIACYESLLLQGQLQKIDALLLQTSPEVRESIGRWCLRKIG